MPAGLLGILKSAKGAGRGQIPGPELSRTLGITRSAVWKQITRLRQNGYKIDAGKGGYGLVESPDLSAEELRLLLPPVNIIYKKNLGSTNGLALSLCEKLGREGPAIAASVIADSQGAGRGRLGRSWQSPPGANIYMSIVFRPAMPPRRAPLLALAAGLASALAIRAQTGLDVRLKWPNDLMAGKNSSKRKSKKLGGILLELRSDPDNVLFAVAGIGINVNISRKDLPRNLKAKATSILAETGRKANRAALIASIHKELAHWIERFRKNPEKAGAALLKAYSGLSETIGKEILVHTEGKTYKGTASGIDGEGRLLLRTKLGGRLTFSTGDVLKVRGGR
ncbi:MAG: biotin--[acetyl-CoA-carboxylase] ligase [Nitrospiraceae bacterium]|nr:biotin--[acetyl-CoA-carboxylase] ligase [Nitrospiraceae bacterium]